MQLLIISGLGNSGPKHWQSLWLQKYNNAFKVLQDEWDEPKLDDWLKKLHHTILTLDKPTILVAHSLAVSLVLHWAKKYNSPMVKGVMLVAPADVDSATHTPDIIRGFSPMPLVKLPFPSVVVASNDDSFVTINRAEYFAEQWGSDFVNIGAKGHINSDSNLELWEEGQIILQKLMDSAL